MIEKYEICRSHCGFTYARKADSFKRVMGVWKVEKIKSEVEGMWEDTFLA
jgi:hypothetical protein